MYSVVRLFLAFHPDEARPSPFSPPPAYRLLALDFRSSFFRLALSREKSPGLVADYKSRPADLSWRGFPRRARERERERERERKGESAILIGMLKSEAPHASRNHERDRSERIRANGSDDSRNINGAVVLYATLRKNAWKEK